MGERLHGMQEVNGSIPFTSTNLLQGRPAARGREKMDLDPIV